MKSSLTCRWSSCRRSERDGTEKKELDPATSVDKATADRWQDWLYDYAERNKLELTVPERRVAEGWWLGVVCPWVDEHRTGAGKDDSTVLGILDGRSSLVVRT